MTNRAEATAAPGTFTLDGTEYQMSPLTDEIIGRLDNWLRTSIIRMGRMASQGQPPLASETIMSASFVTARRMSWYTEGAAAMRTVEGSAQLLFETCRQYHPDVTVKQLEDGIRDNPAGFTEAMDVFALLNPSRGAKKKATMKTETTDSSPAKAASTDSSAPDMDGQPTPSPG